MFKFCTVWAYNSLCGRTIPDWKCSSFVPSGTTTSCLGAQYRIGNVQVLSRLGPQLFVWAHNSGLEMFKFCCVWAHNSLCGRTIQDWKCLSFASSGPTTPCLGTQFRTGNVKVLYCLGPQFLVWANNSGLEMFKFCCVWSQNSLFGHTIPGWKCSSFVSSGPTILCLGAQFRIGNV